MKNKLSESLSYLEMEGHVTPILEIDQFQSSIGEDSDLIVLNFIVDGKAVADDLVKWLERGYDFVIDAETSPGEVLDKKYYVFSEIERRTSAPERIIEILKDLKTLTGYKLEDWKIKLDDNKYAASIESLEQHLPLSPADYNRLNNIELNEWRNIAGLKTANTTVQDDELIEWQRKARII
jgi:hypothetical protein